MNIFGYVTIGSAVLLAILILVQSRGASLGAGFGGSSEIHTTRRGVDKSLHQATVIVAIVFVMSVVSGIIFSV